MAQEKPQKTQNRYRYGSPLLIIEQIQNFNLLPNKGDKMYFLGTAQLELSS